MASRRPICVTLHLPAAVCADRQPVCTAQKTDVTLCFGCLELACIQTHQVYIEAACYAGNSEYLYGLKGGKLSINELIDQLTVDERLFIKNLSFLLYHVG